MCGIAGVLFADRQRTPDRARLQAMGDALAHRGPDAEGFWTGEGVGLVHRRLSIIDLAGGQQPLGNEDDSIQVVFNGELYNYPQLRQALIARGHHFRTHSDTEVLVHLYEDEGPELVHRLRGMFAFALWDQRYGRLLLARDRLGIKPLYWYRDRERLLFASEPKAILTDPSVPIEVDFAAIDNYLTFGVLLGGQEVFRHIRSLTPGHWLAIDADHWDTSPRRYWRLQIVADESRSLADWEDSLRAKVDETVKAHLLADVPVGAFLSGGIDSSVVVGLAAPAYAGNHTAGGLQTFSIGFDDRARDELPYARQVAAQFRTVHREETVVADAAQLLDELVHYYDEPFADSSAVPTYLVSRLARQHVKVALSGDGGDEAFGGYTRYAHDLREDAVRRQLPRWLRQNLLRWMSDVWPKADWLPRPLRLKTFLTNLSLTPAGAYANTLSVCRPPLRSQLLSRALRAELNGHHPERIIEQIYRHAPADDPLAAMLQVDTETFLPDDFLVKVDRASMAHGLEVRPPLLDHELLELAAQIPSPYKVRGGETKWIFKRVFADLLPPDILRRAKHGFESPVDRWLAGPLQQMFRDTVLDPHSAIADLIDQQAAQRLFEAHQSGSARVGQPLWALLVLARWSERYLRRPTGEAHRG